MTRPPTTRDTSRNILVALSHTQHDRLEALAATWQVSRPAALRRLLDEATTATASDIVTLLRAVLAQNAEPPHPGG